MQFTRKRKTSHQQYLEETKRALGQLTTKVQHDYRTIPWLLLTYPVCHESKFSPIRLLYLSGQAEQFSIRPFSCHRCVYKIYQCTCSVCGAVLVPGRRSFSYSTPNSCKVRILVDKNYTLRNHVIL